MLTVCLLSNRATLDQDDATWSGSIIASDGEIVYATGPVGSCAEAHLLVTAFLMMPRPYDWALDEGAA